MPSKSSDSAEEPLAHEDVELFISRAWDGDLSPEETQWLVDHLRRCPDCSARSKRFLHFLTRLSEFADSDGPADDE